MNTITRRHILALGPCYDPSEIGLDDNMELTPVEFIDQFRDKVRNKSDVIWLLCRYQYMSARDMRLFAVWCAREALQLAQSPDPRSVNVCDVAENYANGDATSEELKEARDAAANAASTAASTAAAYAAAPNASYAASDAAWAASDAVYVAADASDADSVAAHDAALDAQIDYLREHFEQKEVES